MDLKEEALSADRTHLRELQAKDELLIDVVNHLRHDWMNDIQVLYGYLRLKKYDKMTRFMETIKQKAARESLISKLGVTELIVYLQTFRVRCPMIQLEVELEPDFNLKELSVNAERVADLTIAVLDCFQAHTYESANGESHYLQMEWIIEDEQLALCFDFRGTYHQAALEQALSEHIAYSGMAVSLRSESEFESQWVTLTIYIPVVRE
jgi:stage 0 sporulation protein B (sporulation initiation phosphotransferase)